MKRPLQLLLAATLAVCAWTWWRGRVADDAATLIPAPTAPLADRALPIADVEADATAAVTPLRAPQINLFPAQSWAEPAPPPARPPPPPPASSLPPEKPVAPPLPFRPISVWWGRDAFYAVISAGSEEIRLCAACGKDDFHQVGSVVFGEYRVEKVQPDQIELVHLPTGTHQSMMLPGVATSGAKP